VIDMDLARAKAHIEIAADAIGRTGGMIAGNAYVPREWLVRKKALAAVNGGYFGREASATRRELIGLFIQNGRVRRAAPQLFGSGGHGLKKGYYVRSAFGLTRSGTPSIVWAATDPLLSQRVIAYTGPLRRSGDGGSEWVMEQAVGCGPTLIAPGISAPTDRQERLADPRPAPRTFLAYDRAHGKPRHFVMGIAESMTYDAVARFLRDYFRREHGGPPAVAMCVDGGASTQMTYRYQDQVLSPRDTGVMVPDAIVIVPYRTVSHRR
jgi:exopolysaccharide biosynthesis protein